MYKQVDTNLLSVAYRERGPADGPVVLLLHGWPDDATTWDGILQPLAEAGYRVLAPWLRGFSPTTFRQPDTPRTGNAAMLALDMLDFLDALGVDKLSLVGHDWGSNIAEALAVGWPDRIGRLAQLSTPPRLGGLKTPPFQHAQLQWYHWFQATKRGQEAVKADPIGFAKIMWDNWSPKGWYDQATFDKVSQRWQNPDFVPVTLHSYQARWDEAEPDPRSRFLDDQVKATQTLSLPALYVQGEVDGVNPPWVSESVHEKFTGPFTRVVLPGVGHFPSREAPDRLSHYLLRFLADQPIPDAHLPLN